MIVHAIQTGASGSIIALVALAIFLADNENNSIPIPFLIADALSNYSVSLGCLMILGRVYSLTMVRPFLLFTPPHLNDDMYS